jgi:hypothetical protein
MTSFQVRTRYDRLYEATRKAGLTLPTTRLALTLEFLMQRSAQGEGWWGAIDAITDLLGRIAPPSWRQELYDGEA